MDHLSSPLFLFFDTASHYVAQPDLEIISLPLCVCVVEGGGERCVHVCVHSYEFRHVEDNCGTGTCLPYGLRQCLATAYAKVL